MHINKQIYYYIRVHKSVTPLLAKTDRFFLRWVYRFEIKGFEHSNGLLLLSKRLQVTVVLAVQFTTPLNSSVGLLLATFSVQMHNSVVSLFFPRSSPHAMLNNDSLSSTLDSRHEYNHNAQIKYFIQEFNVKVALCIFYYNTSKGNSIYFFYICALQIGRQYVACLLRIELLQ